MKELSIEEKAKRYDEALHKAKNYYSTTDSSSDIKLIGLIFPELKESEDERIRKHLIKHFGNKSKTDWNGMPVDKIIAWLEKQGENNKWKPSKDEMDALYGLAYITNKMDDKKDEAITKLYQDLKREFFSGVSYENIFPLSPVDASIKPEKQAEQKPADEVGNYDHKEVIQTIINEQKPAEWEPQTGDTFRKKGTTSPTYHLCDKRKDGITFGFVENREVGIAGGEITIFALKDDYELVERPKSIEDVIEEELNKGLQNKVGQNPWSKEDESRLNNLFHFLYEYGEQYYGALTLDVTIGWLKSLKERYTWKPSDEQMEILQYLCENSSHPNKKVIPTLKSLFQDLKKLREE